ncbi:hypothetical protein [Aureivirga sp. CE67]|uniref:hypothetical protein n=1 Tax=Aureivirga sp. CE67 TaxID=1788983 RepID=UPI0018CAAC45|nr:hypothetical protein [Aureivirga sp. CE67]
MNKLIGVIKTIKVKIAKNKAKNLLLFLFIIPSIAKIKEIKKGSDRIIIALFIPPATTVGDTSPEVSEKFSVNSV